MFQTPGRSETAIPIASNAAASRRAAIPRRCWLRPHRKPYPDEKEPTCEGAGPTRHIVLGTDFITDIALFSMEVTPPLQLKPGHYPTDVALRTVSEALAKAASQLLEIEPGELMAEYRPRLRRKDATA